MKAYALHWFLKDCQRLLRMTEWSDTENKVLTCRFYEYDTYKNCVKEELFHLGFGTVIQEIKPLYQYTPDGNWARKTIYNNANIKCFVDNKLIKKGVF